MSKSENKKSALIQFALPDNEVFRQMVGNDISINNEKLVKFINNEILIIIKEQVALILGKDVKDISDDVSLYDVYEKGKNIILTFNVNMNNNDDDDNDDVNDDNEKNLAIMDKENEDKEKVMSNLGTVDEVFVEMLVYKAELVEQLFGDDFSINNEKLIDFLYSEIIPDLDTNISQIVELNGGDKKDFDIDISEIKDEGEFLRVTLSIKMDSVGTEEVIEDFLVCCDTLDDCITFANSIVIKASEFKNSLYKYNDKYYFYFDEYLTASLEATILEGMGEVSFSAVEITRVLEHGEVVIEEDAIQKLSKVK